MSMEIPKANNLAQKVFSLSNEKAFTEIALEVFWYQFEYNPVYRSFCNAIGRNPDNVFTLTEIPFLPIRFFKSAPISTGSFIPEAIFRSSGTTANTTSQHQVKSLAIYRQSFLTCFEKFYGRPEAYCILGLLPSYLEQGSSSLVYMVDSLIKESRLPQSGFYLYDHQKLKNTLVQLEKEGQPTLLFGVTYALLDFAEEHPMPLNKTIILETGGMKGRKKEIAKMELYDRLRKAFSTENIHAEYGMTELLSQAYAINGLYRTPPWMQVLLRDETDPFELGKKSGAINIIDLANLHSCSFIATEDLGRLHPDGRFEVAGRLDNTDIRGCSQLAL